jgi:hypothetical protein
MNPSWIPAICASLGLLANLIWTIVNLQMRADLAKQIAELKEWMSHEYVPQEMCSLRHAIKGDRGEHGRDAV